MVTRKEAENCLGRKVKIKVRKSDKLVYRVKDIDEDIVIFEGIDSEKPETCFFLSELEEMTPID